MSEFILFFMGLFLGITFAYSHVTENQWTQGQELCKSNGGLSSFISQTAGQPEIRCVNGAKFTLKREKE